MLQENYNNIGRKVSLKEDSNELYKKYGIKELEDGLTIEKIKKNWPWLLKGKMKNAVLGLEPKNIPALKSGEWLGGGWFGGVFKNSVFKGGVFHKGVFKNSDWRGGEWIGGGWDDSTINGKPSEFVPEDPDSEKERAQAELHDREADRMKAANKQSKLPSNPVQNISKNPTATSASVIKTIKPPKEQKVNPDKLKLANWLKSIVNSDYQNTHDGMKKYRVGTPTYISVEKSRSTGRPIVVFGFYHTEEYTSKRWVDSFIKRAGFKYKKLSFDGHEDGEDVVVEF